MKVAVAGLICLDMTPVFGPRDGQTIFEALEPGSLVHIEGCDIHLGGCVANTGLAMDFFGTETLLIGKIGNDPYGRIVLDTLKERNLHKYMVVSESFTTSYSFIIAYPKTDRIFLHHAGGNDVFEADDIGNKILEDVDLLHFGYPTIMKSMYKNGGKELVKLFKKAKSYNTITSLDLSAMDPTSKAAKENWEMILAHTLPYIDIFTPSIEEIIFMLDRPAYDRIVAMNNDDFIDAIDINRDVDPIIKKLHQLGAKAILMKCGKLGLYFSSNKEFKNPYSINSWHNIQRFEASYKAPKLVSATGAGDTSIAAFLTAFINGKSPSESLSLATAIGALCVSAYDSQSGLKSLDEVQKMIGLGWEKNII